MVFSNRLHAPAGSSKFHEKLAKKAEIRYEFLRFSVSPICGVHCYFAKITQPMTKQISKLSPISSQKLIIAASIGLLAGCGGGNGSFPQAPAPKPAPVSAPNPGPAPNPNPSPTPAPAPAAAPSGSAAPLVVKCMDTPTPADPSTTQLSAGDPLYAFQWFLKNTGQQVFADTFPCAGVDLNIGTLHEQGITGKGVTVAIVDSGMDIHHEDLVGNVVPGGSVNFADGSDDPVDPGGHGTAVAGIVAASAHNGLGGRGVAPQASLKAFNVGEKIYSDLPDQRAILRRYLGYSWGEADKAKNVDVFNNSLGLPPDGGYPKISSAEIQDWEGLMSKTRQGRGGVYVWAGGNGFTQPKDMETATDQFAGCPANAVGLSCVLTTFDFPSNLISMITVGSVNARGTRSFYSSAGSSLWVSAPGGEGGLQQSVAGQGKSDGYGPGILSTDTSGCSEDQGLNISATRENALSGGSVWDPSCKYNAAFGGTSSAAPMVSGIAAMILQVNPALSQRDVKYILASTARPLDLAQARVTHAGTTVEPGWVKNAAGFLFSNWYGFGMVDASAAVAKAKDFKGLPAFVDSAWIASNDAPAPIGTAAAPGVMRVRIDQDFVIEAVQFKLGSSHGQPSQLLATLTSPSGTVSYVLSPLSNLSDTPNFAIPLSSSNAFFGESARGQWTLQLSDVSGKPLNAAQLQSFQLRVVGHQKL